MHTHVADVTTHVVVDHLLIFRARAYALYLLDSPFSPTTNFPVIKSS